MVSTWARLDKVQWHSKVRLGLAHLRRCTDARLIPRLTPSLSDITHFEVAKVEKH